MSTITQTPSFTPTTPLQLPEVPPAETQATPSVKTPSSPEDQVDVSSSASNPSVFGSDFMKTLVASSEGIEGTPSTEAGGGDAAATKAAVEDFFDGTGRLTSSVRSTTRGGGSVDEIPQEGFNAAEEHIFTNENGEQMTFDFTTETAEGAGHYSYFSLGNEEEYLPKEGTQSLDQFSFSVNGETFTEADPGARELAGQLAEHLASSGQVSHTSKNLVANLNLIAQPHPASE